MGEEGQEKHPHDRKIVRDESLTGCGGDCTL